jgi:hypothetical protein
MTKAEVVFSKLAAIKLDGIKGAWGRTKEIFKGTKMKEMSEAYRKAPMKSSVGKKTKGMFEKDKKFMNEWGTETAKVYGARAGAGIGTLGAGKMMFGGSSDEE